MKSPEEKYADYMASGKEYAAQQDWATAIIQFKNAARTDAEAADPYYQLSLAYLQLGQGQEAVNAVRQALAADPDHVEANLLLARFMVGQEDPQILSQAEEILTGILGESRSNPDALFVLAATRARLGALQDAESLLEEALATAPDHLSSSIALAKLRITEGNLGAAEQVLEDAVAKSADKRQASVALGHFYMGVDQPDLARSRFDGVLSEDPEYGPALLGLGMLESRAGNKEATERAFKRLSSLDEKAYKPIYAQTLVAHGKVEEGLAELERLAAEDPANRDIRNRLISVLLSEQRLDEVEAILDEVLADNEDDTDARLQRAELLRRRGRLEEAERDLGAVLEYRPDSAPAHYYLARIHAQRRNLRLQRQELDEALRLQPDYLVARLELAKAMLTSPNPRSALDVLNEAPEEQQSSIGLVAARIWTLTSLGDDQAARTLLDQTMTEGSSNAEFLIQDGLLKMRAKQYDAARASAQKALEIAPTDLRALNIIAGSYAAQRQPAQAVSVIEKQAAAYPRYADLQLTLAGWYERVGDQTKARQAYEKVLGLGDDSQLAAIKLATYDVAAGDMAAAEAKLNAALEDNPTNLRVLLTLASVQEQSKKFSAAMDTYRAVIDVSPDYYPALNNLAYLLSAETDRLNEALAFAQQAKQSAPPDQGLVDDTLGWIYYLQELYPTALRHLRDAARSQPENAIVQYHLAMAEAKAGDVEAGKRAYEQAVQLDANLPEAAEAQKVLESAE